ncbi:hypothetical protein EYZ11_013536 [Aspergillus tanneri]|uniref:Uncharacterized protein n=1 Tax=Aspergillus tanneri TaxID=1220188 RepID=A0A4S3IZM9_9EURO|nr:hypothetical protein EYZ11_013536 [Aspergillus tanneri]
MRESAGGAVTLISKGEKLQ